MGIDADLILSSDSLDKVLLRNRKAGALGFFPVLSWSSDWVLVGEVGLSVGGLGVLSAPSPSSSLSSSSWGCCSQDSSSISSQESDELHLARVIFVPILWDVLRVLGQKFSSRLVWGAVTVGHKVSLSLKDSDPPWVGLLLLSTDGT